MIATDADALKWYWSAKEEQLGRFGETVWSNILKASDVFCIPLAQIENGGAPKMESGSGGVVLPDFDVASADGAWSLFLDSKCKSGPVLWRKTGQLRHGIDLRNYLAYKRVSETFRKRAGICIVELFKECEKDLERRGAQPTWSGRLLVEALTNIGEPILDDPNAIVIDRKAYWPAKAFCDLDTLGPLELMNVARNIGVKSYRMEFEQIFAKQRQRALFA